jgi:2-oxo-4-hydroxy-4-carboxy-5-ureidoimidazoline decarboxylase
VTSKEISEESTELGSIAQLPPVPAGSAEDHTAKSVECHREGEDGRRAGESAGQASAGGSGGGGGRDAVAAGLDVLNTVGRAEAVAALSACCASRRWAERMAALRPFPLLEAVLAAAEETWWRLEREDWLEAFAAHPRIGERAAEGPADRGWSAGEQAGAAGMEAARATRLAEANREYEERFGWVYLVCATGKSGDEMLDLLERRLGDDPEHELRVAAGEQAKITRLRLEKLLAELGEPNEEVR